MGEGKTRVILPMLALQWAHTHSASGTPARQRPIVRLHFLPQLMNEAYDHLHHCLTASLLNHRIFTMPYHRQVREE